MEWIQEFGRSYGTKEEYHFRFEQFKKQMAFIAQHDEEYYGHSVGLNEFSDYTDAEYKRMLGAKIDKNITITANATKPDGTPFDLENP